MRLLLPLAALALATPASAATVIFADDFNAETPRLAETSALAQWTVTGNVDLVAEANPFGITQCPGVCVDLDGTTGPGRITSVPIAFAAGQLLTLSFDVSGNQRSGTFDQFEFTVTFGQPTDITGFNGFGAIDMGQLIPGDYTGLLSLGTYSESLFGSRALLTYGLVWTPQTSGTMQLAFWTTSADNIGPILDNVLVTQVPEPATWAMLIAGFGLVGAAARRRRPAHA